jgi:hypothetical protein
MNLSALLVRILTLLAWLVPLPLMAQVPPVLNHQGRIAVGGTSWQGTGQFKFALVNGGATISFWSNDGTSAAGSQPVAAVALPVVKGLYAVLLGDATLTNMAAIPPSVFENADVRLRVWFNDGTHGFQQISPDQRLAAAPYALQAARVDQVLLSQVKAPPVKPVVAWGKNTNGQTTVPSLADVASIAAGASHSVVVLKDGNVVQWGSMAPVPAGLANVMQVAAGTAHNLARRSDGSLTAWGDNTYQQCQIPAVTNAIAVAAGEKHSLALLADGTVIAWGDNTFGQITVPPAAIGVTAIAAGYDHSLALLANGTVIAWGRNDAGVGQCDVPAGLTGVASIAAGAYHSLAVKQDGSLAGWGLDGGGQCTIPSGLNNVAKVAAGYSFSVALKKDGALFAWGDNTDNQLLIPTGTADITAVAAGASHVLALKADLIPAAVARLDQPSLFTAPVGVRRNPTANVLEVEGQASKTTAGNWLANSDRRIKTDIQPITGALERLDRVRLVDFRYTPDYLSAHPALEDTRYLNVVAQEFAEVFPAHVKSSGETLPDGSPILQVDTYPLTIYSAAAVQELHRENQALKARLADQEARLQRLESAAAAATRQP